MPVVKSLDDLRRAREAAVRQRQAARVSARALIVVDMGTPSLAVGARATLQAFQSAIEQDGLAGVVVRQTGDIGLDSFEPVAQVTVGGGPTVVYGNVTPAVARRIVREHIAGGRVVSEHVIEGAYAPNPA
jgi:NADP-reducing hydrogenase subunit HndB